MLWGSSFCPFFLPALPAVFSLQQILLPVNDEKQMVQVFFVYNEYLQKLQAFPVIKNEGIAMENLIKREHYLNQLAMWREEKVIKVVTGVRRCGKSTLFELFKERCTSNLKVSLYM